MSIVPVLTIEEARAFLASIDTGTLVGLRDRAVIGLMAGAGCSAQATVRLTLGDVLQQDGGVLLRLQYEAEHGRLIACPAKSQAWLQAYLDRAGLQNRSELVFRAGAIRSTVLPRRPLSQRGIFSMINHRAEGAGLRARLGYSAFQRGGLGQFLQTLDWLAADSTPGA